MNETEYRSLIIEVLDKVPDYDEYKQMEEQINNLQKMLEYECSKRCELEAQLAEANKVIRFYENDYLKKYGVEK